MSLGSDSKKGFGASPRITRNADEGSYRLLRGHRLRTRRFPLRLVEIEEMGQLDLSLFATSPQSKDVDASEYRDRVAAVARWSEEAGFSGILVYADNGLVDPWLVSQLIIESTETLSPLVAVQPVYVHPYSAAKMVASLGY